MTASDTLPGLVLENARRLGDRPAMREKDLGIWRTHTWQEYAGHVRDFALGLQSLGFGQGDKLCVIGDNRPRLYWAQFSAMAVGGIAVPVYQDSIATELAYVLQDADVKVVVAEDQEQVDKILSIRDQIPSLEVIIFDDPRGMTDYRDDMLKPFGEVEALGADVHGQNPTRFEEVVNALDASNIAMMAYTSGTTGKPKGVMLSHQNLVSAGRIYAENEDIQSDDDFFSYLPLAWIGEALYGMTVSVIVGCTSNCPEGPETIERDLRELGPTGLIAAPRVWETMLSRIQVRANDASALKRVVFRTFRDVGVKAETLIAEGKPVPVHIRLLRWLGEFVVYGPVRDQLGLRRAKWSFTGGAPLGPDTFRFFRAFGINLKQVYGSTEVSGLVSFQLGHDGNPDNVGLPCPGIDVKIAENGEVLVKSPGVFQGYYKNEEATQEAIDAEGWFHTGDAGIIEKSGHLTIIDRAKDVGKLSDGSAFAPQYVENKLKYSPYISEAVAFGHDRPHVCAMIAIDFNTVSNWAERLGLPYSTYMDLSQKAEVRDLVSEEIRRINLTLPEVSRIRRFLLLAKDLDADDEEVTRTRKLRRSFIAQKYQRVIDAFYDGQGEVELSTEVTFEDGRKSMLETQLTILEAA
jgi:long-chain acyl-CoA synthetase